MRRLPNFNSIFFITRLLRVSILAAAFFLPTTLLGQTLHLIQIEAATAAKPTVRQNALQWQAFAQTGGYAFRASTIDLNQMRDPGQLFGKLLSVPVAANDVVICYYVGPAQYHENDLLDNFPYFQLGNQVVSQNTLHRRVQELQGRLSISFFDVQGAQTGSFAGWNQEKTLSYNKVRQLLEVRGDFLVTSFTRFEEAYYNRAAGSIFGACLSQALRQICRTQNDLVPTWSSVIDQTNTYMDAVLLQAQKSQNAYYEANLRNEPSSWSNDQKTNRTDGLVYSYAIPDFPFPPPPASSSQSLSKTLFRQAETMDDVNQRLINAISACGYYEKSYYALPGGFALVTRIEQIRQDASPMEGTARWNTEILNIEEFSLQAYLKALFTERKGYFRVFVFMVTNQPFGQTGAPVDQETAKLWISQGLNKLPKTLGSQAFELDHHVSVLVYEFEKTENGKASYLKPGRHTSQTHLEKSRILQFLVQNAGN